MRKYQANINSFLTLSEVSQSELSAAGDSLMEGRIIENIQRLTKYDKGLEMALSNNYLQEINKSAIDKGISFKVEGAVLDNKRLTLSYSLNSEENLPLSLGEFNVVDEHSNCINAYKVYSSSNDFESNKNTGLITLILDDNLNTFPQNITISCSSLESEPCTMEGRTVYGNWNVSFGLNTLPYNVMPKQINLNKSIKVNDMDFTIDYIKMYPTVVDIKLTFNENNLNKFIKFKNLYLRDEKGNMYSWYGLSSVISENELELHFESSYFANSKELYLSFDGIYCIPKEDRYLIYDLDSKALIDRGGYDIEITEDNFNVEHKNKKYDLKLGFKVKDKNILGDDESFLELSSEALNESGEELSITTRQVYIPVKRKLTGDIFIENLRNSHVLKIKIEGASVGIMENTETKLF